MVKAATEAATAATGDKDMIGKVVKADTDTAAKGGDATSVNGIASGIKGIVEAAEKAATAVVLRGLVKLLTFFQLQLKFFCFHLLTFKTIGILFIESFGFKAISSFYIFFFFRNFSL